MDQRSRYLKALSRAEKILGSRARAAEIFLRSRDVIADGPYARGGPRVRVAVIDQR